MLSSAIFIGMDILPFWNIRFTRFPGVYQFA
jgi:hypothetical protein